MLKFYGRIGRSRFAAAMLVRILLFSAFLFGVATLLRAITSVSNCRGACGLIALSAPNALKPFFFHLFLFSLIGIALRRARDIGAPAWVGLFLPLMFAGDATNLTYSGDRWSLAFAAGVMTPQPFPGFALFALAVTVVFALIPSRDSETRNPYGAFGWLALATGALLVAAAALNPANFWAMPFLSQSWWPLIAWVSWIAPYLMVAFILVGIAIAYHFASQAMSPTSGSLPDDRLPINALLLAAIACAGIAITTSLSRSIANPISFFLQLLQVVPHILPTATIYFAVLATFVALVRRRTFSTSVLFVVTLLPLPAWAYAHWTSAHHSANERAKLAAIATSHLSSIPSALVLEVGRPEDEKPSIRSVWIVPEIQYVVTKETNRSGVTKLAQHRRQMPEQESQPTQPPRPIQLEKLPTEFLWLRTGQSSSFYQPGLAFGPYELRMVSPDKDDLISVWYHRDSAAPTLLPVLTEQGWLRRKPIEAPRSIREFLLQAVKLRD